MRVTVRFRKTNGTWMIVHEHFSAPFDPESGKALLDLASNGPEQRDPPPPYGDASA